MSTARKPSEGTIEWFVRARTIDATLRKNVHVMKVGEVHEYTAAMLRLFHAAADEAAAALVERGVSLSRRSQDSNGVEIMGFAQGVLLVTWLAFDLEVPAHPLATNKRAFDNDDFRLVEAIFHKHGFRSK